MHVMIWRVYLLTLVRLCVGCYKALGKQDPAGNKSHKNKTKITRQLLKLLPLLLLYYCW